MIYKYILQRSGAPILTFDTEEASEITISDSLANDINLKKQDYITITPEGEIEHSREEKLSQVQKNRIWIYLCDHGFEEEEKIEEIDPEDFREEIDDLNYGWEEDNQGIAPLDIAKIRIAPDGLIVYKGQSLGLYVGLPYWC